jgi:DNA-binding transcriptional LysR family regulator
MHQAWLEGMGFAFLPKWLISDDLAAGRLERVLPRSCSSLSLTAPALAQLPEVVSCVM